MKIKQLLLSFLTLSVFLVSCSKEEIVGIDMDGLNVNQTQSVSSVSSTSTETNLKAYIFIEPVKKVLLVAKYLKDSVSSTPSRPFLGFSQGVGITDANQKDVLSYMDLKYFYNGQLPSVITTDIPQTSGGVDSYGNPIKAYNFKTIRITKSQINDNAWVTVFIPVEAMKNDTYKQTKILFYGNGLNTFTANMTAQLYNYVFDYNGSRMPKGKYRMYTTYLNPTMRLPMTGSGYFYIKGNN